VGGEGGVMGDYKDKTRRKWGGNSPESRG